MARTWLELSTNLIVESPLSGLVCHGQFGGESYTGRLPLLSKDKMTELKNERMTIWENEIMT